MGTQNRVGLVLATYSNSSTRTEQRDETTVRYNPKMQHLELVEHSVLRMDYPERGKASLLCAGQN